LVVHDVGQVAEALCGIGVVRAEAGLADGQGALEQAAGAIQVT
jgi:hypothetical protein